MFLKLNHQRLAVWRHSKLFVVECYRATNNFPSGEKFNLVSQIRRAASSVHLNISEGCSRKSEMERKRYYEIARGSLIEIDAALDIAHDLGYFRQSDVKTLGDLMLECFNSLSGLIKQLQR